MKYTGLFGYSAGLIIRNVVIDESCSFENTYRLSGFPYVGSVIGYCQANGVSCLIKNCVNLGSVTFSGALTIIASISAGLLEVSRSVAALFL